MDDTTTQPIPVAPVEDFTAQVEAKKALAIGIGTGTAIAAAVGFMNGNWMLAVIVGLVSGFLFGRSVKP